MTSDRDPAIGGAATALVALAGAIVCAAAATGDVTTEPVTIPGAVLGLAVVPGLLLSYLRWRPDRADPTPVNLLVTFALGFGLVLSRTTIDLTDPPGLHPMAEVFLLLLVVRSYAAADPRRVRSALLLSLGAMLAALAGSEGTTAALLLMAWLACATSTLAATSEAALRASRWLGGRPPPRRGRGMLGRGLGAAALVAVIVAAVAVIDPDPGRTEPRLGRDPAGRAVSPYLGHQDTLDTGVRFDDLGDEPVLTVRAPAPDLWRGQTFDRWDGRAWERTQAVDAEYPIPGSAYLAGGIGDVDVGGEAFVQRIRVEAPFVASLFGAYRMDEVDTSAGVLVAHADGSVELRQPLGQGAEYTVVSVRQPVTAGLLRANDPLDPANGGLPTHLARPYLQLPDVPAGVVDLARSITDGQPTTYDKVRAIEAWLGDNVEYTLEIPPLPEGADAVEQFLFVDRKGFCEQIGTALAVLLRSVGVPARLAVGFAPGDESLLGGEFTVRSDDAHAWVEVWFPNVGWQGFDPTASVPLAGESSTTALRRLTDLLARLAPWLVAAALVGLVGAGAWLLGRRVVAARAARQRPWVEVFQSRLEKAGSRRGRPRAESETPAEYADALARSVLPDDRLVAVGAVVTRAAYAAESPTDDERASAELVLTEAEHSSPPPRRRHPFRRGPRSRSARSPGLHSSPGGRMPTQ